MKTTKKQYKEFQRAFLAMRDKLGLLQFRIDFVHADVGDAYATCNINWPGMNATIAMCVEIDDDDDVFDPAHHGRHEAIELLLMPITRMANALFNTEEVHANVHSAVRVLEKVL